jgi:hypothetical protein
MRAASHAWIVAGTWIVWTGCVSRYRPRSPSSAFVSTSVRTVSSRKNGFPRLDQELLQRREPGIVAEERIQHLSGALGRERVQPHLAVGRLAAPGVLVLGTVIHEQQHARPPEALDQAVEQRLRLTVDPVEILEDQEERLFLCFPEQEPLHGVERALASLARVERLPRGVVHGHVEQGHQRR